MLAVVVLIIGILANLYLSHVTEQIYDTARMFQSRAKAMKVVQLAENIERYYAENDVLPASLNVLTSATGFEHTKGLVDNWQAYGVSGTLTDGVWSYQRAVLAMTDPAGGVMASDFMATNACGTGAYSTASSWCGDRTGRWYRRETRESFNDEITSQRVKMHRTLQKFADYFSYYGYFPKVDAGGVALATNSVIKLATLAGYAGANNSCTGARQYVGVPVDCSDMFDQWGGAIGYQFVNKRHVILTSETPIFNSSGNRVVVSAELDNSQF